MSCLPIGKYVSRQVRLTATAGRVRDDLSSGEGFHGLVDVWLLIDKR